MIVNSLRRERLVWAAAALVALAVGAIVGRVSTAPPAVHVGVKHGMHAGAHGTPVGARVALQTRVACRPGAFLEADRILGSVVVVARAMPAAAPVGARGELDSILLTALQQARAEVHCVAGVLTHGYDKSYADTMRSAVSLAEQRGLSPDVAALGRDVVRALEANQPMGPIVAR